MMPRRLLNIPPTTLAVIAIIACSIAALYIIQEIERTTDNKERDTLSAKRTLQLDNQATILKTIYKALAEDRHNEHVEQTTLLKNISKSLSEDRRAEHKQIIDLINNLGNKTK